MNDGSNDESERVIEQLKASSQVPITSVNQVNHGVSAARNVGIARLRVIDRLSGCRRPMATHNARVESEIC